MQNPLKQLEQLGQSIWLDFIDRNLIASGNRWSNKFASVDPYKPKEDDINKTKPGYPIAVPTLLPSPNALTEADNSTTSSQETTPPMAQPTPYQPGKTIEKVNIDSQARPEDGKQKTQPSQSNLLPLTPKTTSIRHIHPQRPKNQFAPLRQTPDRSILGPYNPKIHFNPHTNFFYSSLLDPYIKPTSTGKYYYKKKLPMLTTTQKPEVQVDIQKNFDRPKISATTSIKPEEEKVIATPALTDTSLETTIIPPPTSEPAIATAETTETTQAYPPYLIGAERDYKYYGGSKDLTSDKLSAPESSSDEYFSQSEYALSEESWQPSHSYQHDSFTQKSFPLFPDEGEVFSTIQSDISSLGPSEEYEYFSDLSSDVYHYPETGTQKFGISGESPYESKKYTIPSYSPVPILQPFPVYPAPGIAYNSDMPPYPGYNPFLSYSPSQSPVPLAYQQPLEIKKQSPANSRDFLLQINARYPFRFVSLSNEPANYMNNLHQRVRSAKHRWEPIIIDEKLLLYGNGFAWGQIQQFCQAVNYINVPKLELESISKEQLFALENYLLSAKDDKDLPLVELDFVNRKFSVDISIIERIIRIYEKNPLLHINLDSDFFRKLNEFPQYARQLSDLRNQRKINFKAYLKVLIDNNDINQLQKIFENSSMREKYPFSQKSLLGYAAEKGKLECVKFFLDPGSSMPQKALIAAYKHASHKPKEVREAIKKYIDPTKHSQLTVNYPTKESAPKEDRYYSWWQKRSHEQNRKSPETEKQNENHKEKFRYD